jgi:hypothetical protein
LPNASYDRVRRVRVHTQTNFHVELVYRTATPLFLELCFLGVAMFAQTRIPAPEITSQRKPRSKLMSEAASRHASAIRTEGPSSHRRAAAAAAHPRV